MHSHTRLSARTTKEEDINIPAHALHSGQGWIHTLCLSQTHTNTVTVTNLRCASGGWCLFWKDLADMNSYRAEITFITGHIPCLGRVCDSLGKHAICDTTYIWKGQQDNTPAGKKEGQSSPVPLSQMWVTGSCLLAEDTVTSSSWSTVTTNFEQISPPELWTNPSINTGIENAWADSEWLAVRTECDTAEDVVLRAHFGSAGEMMWCVSILVVLVLEFWQ